MNELTWRPAGPGDAEGLANLFEAVEHMTPMGRDTGVADLRSRLSKPSLDLDRDTLVAVDPGGRPRAYGETADMGVGDGVLRVSLVGVVQPDLGEDVRLRVHDWLMHRAYQIRDERQPGVPLMLGARCAAADRYWLGLLTGSGFDVVEWELDYLRVADATVPATPVPDGVSIVPYDTRYDEPARRAHNEVYADSPVSFRLDARAWRKHTTGDPRYLADASLLAVEAGTDDVLAFLFSLVRPDEAFLHCLGTTAPWRGRGLASAMVSRALGAHHAAGLHRTRLNVRSDNKAAVRLYDRFGFADTGRSFAVCVRQPT